MNQTNEHVYIPDWKLERYLLKELDGVEMERIRQAARGDESVRARLEALEESNRQIHQEYPPGWMSQQIRAKLAKAAAGPSKTRRGGRIQALRTVLVPAGLLAVVALAMFALPDLLPTGDRIDSEVTRFKGPGAQLRIHRKTEGGSQQLADGDRASEHELILLQYRAEDEAYGAILSVDGWGTITTHLPAQGNQAAKVDPGPWHLLDFAYELDDAPRWEIFFLATSRSQFQVEAVIQALAKSPLVAPPREVGRIDEDFLSTLEFPSGLRIVTFTLIKDPGHEN